MSTTKLDTSGIFEPLKFKSHAAPAGLVVENVQLGQNGVEFQTTQPLPMWSELSVEVLTQNRTKIRGTGVVVACQGNRGMGYHVSLLFLNFSPQSPQRSEIIPHAG